MRDAGSLLRQRGNGENTDVPEPSNWSGRERSSLRYIVDSIVSTNKRMVHHPKDLRGKVTTKSIWISIRRINHNLRVSLLIVPRCACTVNTLCLYVKSTTISHYIFNKNQRILLLETRTIIVCQNLYQHKGLLIIEKKTFLKRTKRGL